MTKTECMVKHNVLRMIVAADGMRMYYSYDHERNEITKGNIFNHYGEYAMTLARIAELKKIF